MEKNPKACEPCRRRKVRCNGQTPCNRCERKPAECLYRLRTRVRKSAVHKAAAASNLNPTDGRGGGAGASAGAGEQAGVQHHIQTSHQTSSPPRFNKHILVPEAGGPQSETAYSNVYHGVTATRENDVEPSEATETSRLFYGPASQFGYLLQIHRAILSSSAGPNGQQGDEVLECRPSLDLFAQRSFFFGTGSRVDASAFHRPSSTILPDVSLAQATIFLKKFKSWSAHILPFFTDAELDKMLHSLYSDEGQNSRPSQTKAISFAVLAIGALSTPHTDLAEVLLAKAKFEAVLFDDTVSLQMIQFSLLLADYQTSMGRPNLTYLHLGTACRKAFALGLHREAANSLARSEDAQKCRTTLWCLYSLESWYSMTVGRESSLKMADISSPFPDNQPLIVSLSCLARIAENCARVIYTQRYDSLRKLYLAAEDIHSQLRDYSAKHGIGSASLDGHCAASNSPASLLLHNLFYHTILLTYRPFMVADYALAAASETQPQNAGGQNAGGAMWLRQACRYAVDTAQDAIVYTHNQIQTYEPCRTARYQGFFLESSCAVLLFDILRHPSKYPYNVEYINMALQCLDMAINDEPITNTRTSIRKILRVVEETISKKKAGAAAPTGSTNISALTDPLLHTTNTNPTLPSPTSFMNRDQHQHHQHQQHQHQQHQQQQQQQQQQHPHASIQFPSLNAVFSSNASPPSQLIYFSNIPGSPAADSAGCNTFPMPGLSGPDSFAGTGEGLNQLSHFHCDVLTTDLYNYFPINTTPRSTTGNEAGVSMENGGGDEGFGDGKCPR